MPITKAAGCGYFGNAGSVVIDTSRHKEMVAVRLLSGLLTLLLCFGLVPAFGEEIPAGQPHVPDNVVPSGGGLSATDGYVDRSHAYLDRKINGLVAWFDGLFGYTAAGRDTASAENRLEWSNELRTEKGKDLAYRSSLRAHVRLPKFQKMVKLVIIEENREEAVATVPSDPGTPVVNTPTKANTLRALNTELRYYALDSKAGYAFLSAGSRFVWPLETFVRARLLWRHLFADNTFISPSVTPFWQDHIGLGITPQLDFGHPFANNNIFLWTNSATVFDKRSGFLWGTEVSLSRVLSPVSAIAFSVGANGSTQVSVVADRFNMGANNYRVAVKYRRNIYRPWLFLEFIPETNWLRDEDGGREFIPAFTARLEINSLGHRALVPVPLIVKEHLPIPEYGHN